MSESIHRFITAGYAVSIDFTKQGRRQFAKVNRSLGRRYIRAFILKRDLAEYIAAHEAAGVHLDTECHELRYDEWHLPAASEGTWPMAHHGGCSARRKRPLLPRSIFGHSSGAAAASS